jgi:hypothetical protein
MMTFSLDHNPDKWNVFLYWLDTPFALRRSTIYAPPLVNCLTTVPLVVEKTSKGCNLKLLER